MRYLSVCSGIEAASVAWHPLGWTPAAFAEIEAFPRAVLALRFPGVPLHGDFTTIKGDEYGPIDLLVGGTPCQSFSVAGLRGGLADDRGNLALEFLRLAQRTRARWLVWENVPGVLSTNGGRDFGSILGGLVELGYGFAYRVLDAQFFGVPQRRRRVFVVGYLGDWRRPAAVLFERQSLSGDPAPRRQAGQGVGAGTLRSTDGGIDIDHASANHLIAHALRAEGFDASEDGTGRGTPLVPVAFSAKDHGADAGDTAPTLRAGGHAKSHANGGVMPAVAVNTGVRRLTPRECERLQGLPDDWTRVPIKTLKQEPRTKHFAKYPDLYTKQSDGSWVRHAADGPRYKALGNSMAVPCMSWIGQRIDLIAKAEGR